MNPHALRDQLRLVGLTRPSAVLLLSLTAVWSVGVFASLAGATGAAPALLALPWVFLTTILAAVFARAELRVPLLICALWSTMIALAVFTASAVAVFPFFAIVPAALAGATWLAAWRPEVSVLACFLLASSFGSVEVLTPLPASTLVELLLAGLWINAIWISLVHGRDRPVWVWPGVIVVGVWLFVTAIQALSTEPFAAGTDAFRQTAWYLMAALLVAYAPWPAGTRERLGKGFLLIALAVGGYATLRYLIGPAGPEAIAGYADSTNILENGGLGLLGSFPSRHQLGAWCAVAVPFCAVLALGYDGRWALGAATATGLCIVGLLGSEVRSSLAGVVAGMAVVLLVIPFVRAFAGAHLGTTVVGVLGAVVLGLSLFALTAGADEKSLKRYEAILEPSRDPAFQARLYKWKTAIAEIDDHPGGHGLATVSNVHLRHGRFVSLGNVELDSNYLILAYEQGLLLTGVLVGGLVLLLVQLARSCIGEADRRRATHALAAAAVLASLLVLGIVGEYLGGLPALAAWLIVGLGMSGFTQPREA